MKKEMWLATLSALMAGGLSAEELTQEQLDKLLAELAKKPAPQDLDFGACCYEMAAVADRIEYVCPVCGGKTILVNSTRPWEEWINEWTLKQYREDVKKVKELGLDAKLDERSLCETCRVKMEPSPQIGDVFLEVKIDDKTTRTKINETDFAKLIAFLEEKDKWKTEAEWERPLKDELPRIRALLGMSEPTEAKTETE